MRLVTEKHSVSVDSYQIRDVPGHILEGASLVHILRSNLTHIPQQLTQMQILDPFDIVTLSSRVSGTAALRLRHGNGSEPDPNPILECVVSPSRSAHLSLEASTRREIDELPR